MGEVYRAVDGNGRLVALKLLDAQLAHDERFRRRFLRESQIAASLDHPNIVRTLSSGDDGGRLFLAMQYIDGEDLRDLLRREGRLEPERAIGLVGQVADALDAAHRAGLVHRDVKPGNILVESGSDGEHAYICDFGLARHVSSVSSLTGDRGFVGTIDYVPPEQIEGGSLGATADEYSLGCVLYECIAGTRPFDRDSELSVVFAHLNEPPPKLTDQRPDLPQAFDDLFATALAKSPHDRFQTCGELADAARAALTGQVRARRKPRRRLALAIALIALVIAAAATGALLLTGGHGQKKLPVTITPTSIGGAKLGDSNITLERRWNGGTKLTTQFPADYSLLRQSLFDVSAYFSGTVDKAVELTTWNANDRTDAGVGPCSSLAELKDAYGKRLRLVPNNHGYGYTVGKHLFFAIGTPPHPRFVSAVAVHSNEIHTAGLIALQEGPCTGPASGTATTAPTAQPSAKPKLPRSFVSKRFSPRVTVRSPSGWVVAIDNGHAFALRSAGGSQAGDQIGFFLDPYASAGDGPKHPGGAPLASVSRTPTGLVNWLRSNPGLIATRPSTTRFGRPVLTARSIDIDLSAQAPKEDPHCPSACISYLAFRGPGYRFPYGTGRGEPARLYFALIRLGSETHTLAITVDSPTKATFSQLLPAATAIVQSLRIDAVPVVELSAFSTYCTRVFNGTCLGELTAGTHSSSTFQPKLTYRVPVGWTNFEDHHDSLGFVPPGGDWQAFDAEKSDALIVMNHVAAARGPCIDPPSTISTPAAYIRSLVDNPALKVTRPKVVTIGGLSGFVVDLRIRKTWKKACPWSHRQPYVQTITDLAPKMSKVDHGVIPQPMVMRLYLLGYRGGTIGIEVDALQGGAKLSAYSAVVNTFQFATD
jgi:hypothetical protein